MNALVHLDSWYICIMNIRGETCSKWYMSEAEKLGEKLTYDEARELVYGMPYSEYKKEYQKEATKEQLEKFNEGKKNK